MHFAKNENKMDGFKNSDIAMTIMRSTNKSIDTIIISKIIFFKNLNASYLIKHNNVNTV